MNPEDRKELHKKLMEVVAGYMTSTPYIYNCADEIVDVVEKTLVEKNYIKED